MRIDIPKECDQCMKCVGCCVVTGMDGYSIASELNALAADGAWNCANCWRCIEVCPQGVDIYGFMVKRRREEEVLSSSVGESMGFSGRVFGSEIASLMKSVNYLGCRLSGFWAGRRWRY